MRNIDKPWLGQIFDEDYGFFLTSFRLKEISDKLMFYAEMRNGWSEPFPVLLVNPWLKGEALGVEYMPMYSVDPENPQLISNQDLLTAEQDAAIRQWIKRHHKALTRHWNCDTDSVEFLEEIGFVFKDE